MRRFYFLVIGALNSAIIALCVYDHVCLREIRSNFGQLTYSLHGPLDESTHLEPKTMEELRLHYERTIGARWSVTKQIMESYAAFETTANIHTAIAVLFVASTFLSFLFVGRWRPKTTGSD